MVTIGFTLAFGLISYFKKSFNIDINIFKLLIRIFRNWIFIAHSILVQKCVSLKPPKNGLIFPNVFLHMILCIVFYIEILAF